MTDPLDDDLRELLERRARVRPEDLAPLRHTIATLPPRRRSRRGLLAAAAGIVVLLGFGALLIARLPLGTSGAAPNPPDPAAFAGDPRLGECGVTSAGAIAIFELAHVRDYPRQLPAAYELKGLDADPEAPALVVVLDGPGSPDRMGSPAPEGSHDLCLVIGADAATWTVTHVAGVDTSGLLASVPEPTGTPIAERLMPWVERCGGSAAGVLAVLQLDNSVDPQTGLVLLPEPPELTASDPVTVVVYESTHPFAPLGSPDAPGATIGPREPLREGHHDVCILVGANADTATRTIREDLLVRFEAIRTDASPTTPGATPDVAPGPTLPPQLAASECAAMQFATDRCLAVVEAAREALDGWWIGVDFGWAAIERVTLGPVSEVTFGGHAVAAVVFLMVDGTTYSHDVRCGGISIYSLVCTDHPEILVTGPFGLGGGYTDTPCGATPGGEPGSACATPMPTIDPDAAAAAVPLEIAARDYPITATGHLEIVVGRATLPNGILSDARFDLADRFTRAFIVEGGIRLEVRSLDPSRPPFDNVYEHGWYPGTEEVEVYLVLDVVSFTPGAALQIRDLVVR
jgi:hypothetical protein